MAFANKKRTRPAPLKSPRITPRTMGIRRGMRICEIEAITVAYTPKTIIKKEPETPGIIIAMAATASEIVSLKKSAGLI